MKYERLFIIVLIALAVITLGLSGKAHAAITDLKFGSAQAFDVQYYWSHSNDPNPDYNCYSDASTCDRLNVSGLTTPYASAGTLQWTQPQLSAGQYYKFFNSTTNPGTYGMGVYNADGTLAYVMHDTGDFYKLGTDAIFYVGGGFFGTVITTTAGYSYGGSAVLNVGTGTPTTQDFVNYTPPSNTVLASGETVSTSGGGGTSTPAYPSYVIIGGGTAGSMSFTETSTLSTVQQGKVDTWNNRTAPSGNQIYIDQIGGDNNTVTINQDGNKNLIRMQLQGTNNNITARQGVQGIGQNEMKLNFEGNNNVVNANQARDTQGNAVGGNGHYLDATIAGWGTNLTVQQTNDGGVGGHYNETTIYGNGNSVTAKQTGNGNKVMFLKVDGAINTVDVTQKGTGQHKLDATLSGNFNNASVLQEGTIANNATLNLTNAGGPATVNVQQNGGQNVTVNTTCSTAGGCAPITVRQGY